MADEIHDVVVIGAGIAGIPVAYFLAKAGLDVCVVEKGIVGGEASGRAAGGVRQNKRPPQELPLAMRSIELWKQMAVESDMDFEYRQHGHLMLAWNEKQASDAMAVVERQCAAGLECYFLDRAETHSLVPALADAYLGGAYSPSCGSAEPYLSCVAMARLAKRAGAIIYEHREVTGIQVADGKVTGVVTTAGRIGTRVVVNTAGPWAPQIARMVGLEIPVKICRSSLLVTEQLPPFLGPFTGTAPYGYFRQTLSGNVLIGWPSQPTPEWDGRTTYEALAVAPQRTATIIPRLRSVSLIRSFTGFTAWTPDERPMLGAVRSPQGFYVGAEFSATGFAMGPVVGELLAELILNGRTSLPIDAFNPERFSQGSGKEEV